MCRRYTFTHTCLHTGISPVLRCSQTPSNTLPPIHSQPPCTEIENIPFHLQICCPFCSQDLIQVALSTQAGQGILTILNDGGGWDVLRVCNAEELGGWDWETGKGGNGGWRQMAWIPLPCGEVILVGGEGDGDERRREVGSVWKERVGWGEGQERGIRSRFAGMMSKLEAEGGVGEGLDSVN